MPPMPVTSATFPRTRATNHNTTVYVLTGMLWHPNDPAAVRMHVAQPGHQQARWLLDRTLLAAGVDAPAGVGDVTVTPALTPGVTEVVLRHWHGIGGNLALHLPTDGLRHFLDRTYLRCPAGQEVYDMDPAGLFTGEDA